MPKCNIEKIHEARKRSVNRDAFNAYLLGILVATISDESMDKIIEKAESITKEEMERNKK